MRAGPVSMLMWMGKTGGFQRGQPFWRKRVFERMKTGWTGT